MLKFDELGHTNENDSCVYVLVFRPSLEVKVLPPTVFQADVLLTDKFQFIPAVPRRTQTLMTSVWPAYPETGFVTYRSLPEPEGKVSFCTSFSL